MTEKPTLKKVQITMTQEIYDATYKKWVSELGFESIQAAARVLLVGKLPEIVSETRKINKNVTELAKLREQAEENKAKKEAPKKAREDLGRTYEAGSKVFEKYKAQWLKNHPGEKFTFEGIRMWLDENGPRSSWVK